MILAVDEMHPKHAGQFYYFLEPKDPSAQPYVLRGELKKGPKGHFEVTMFAHFSNIYKFIRNVVPDEVGENKFNFRTQRSVLSEHHFARSSH